MKRSLDLFNYAPYVILVVGLLLDGSYANVLKKSESIREVDLGRVD